MTPEELRLLDGLEYSEAEALSLNAGLRRAGLEPERAAAVLTQASLRAAAAEKLGPQTARMLLTRPGLEQASRAAITAHRAQRLQEAGIDSVADLGCGIGADAAGYARAGLAVTAVEIDPHTAACAAHNLSPWPRARVLPGDLSALDPTRIHDAAGSPVQALWLDPARRDAGTSAAQRRRRTDPEAFSPPLSLIREWAATGIPMGVKMGPALEHELIPPEAEAEWISHRGEVVELVLWFNALAGPGVRRRASVLGPDPVTPQLLARLGSAEEFGAGPQPPVGPPGALLYEPDGAVIRAQLVQRLAEEVNGRLLDPRIAYVTSEEEHRLPWATGWRIRERLPLHPKKLKAWAREHGVTALTVKKRGVDVVPEQLRRQVLAGIKAPKGSGGGRHETLIVTRWDTKDRGERAVFWVEPLSG